MKRLEIAVESVRQEQRKIRQQYQQFLKASNRVSAKIFQLCEEAPQKQDKGQRRLTTVAE